MIYLDVKEINFIMYNVGKSDKKVKQDKSKIRENQNSERYIGAIVKLVVALAWHARGRRFDPA